MASRVLEQIQWGKETAHGTAVAADTRMFGRVPPPSGAREIVVPKTGSGMRVPGQLDQAFVRKISAEGLQFSTGDEGCYFGMFPLIFCSSLMTETATEQNVGEGDYLWNFAGPLTGAETIDTFTIEVGDDQQAYEAAYGFIPSWTFTGNADSGSTALTAEIMGDEFISTTFTGAIAVPAFQPVLAKQARLYVDDTWAALGTAEIACTLVDWTLSCNGGVMPNFRGSSDRKYCAHSQGEIVITLQLGLERNDTTDTEHDYYLASTVTPRFVRLAIDNGVAIGAGDNSSLVFDLAGVWTDWQAMGNEQDGNNIDVATLTCGYDLTGTSAFSFSVTDVLAAL